MYKKVRCTCKVVVLIELNLLLQFFVVFVAVAAVVAEAP